MNTGNILSTVGVLLFIITLIWGLAWLAMRFKLVPGQTSKRNKNSASALAIVETLTLDTKRRLVKVEDGDHEHLFLLGPTNESHINSKKITTKLPKEKLTKNEQDKK